MPEVAHDAQNEFWRPPAGQPVSLPSLVEVCDGCGSEFMVGSRFCHTCGAPRQAPAGATPGGRWTHYLEVQTIMQRLGLSGLALVALVAGLACVAGAVATGIIYTERTVLEWQAVQIYRIEWLLGATAAFAVGCLLKRSSK